MERKDGKEWMYLDLEGLTGVEFWKSGPRLKKLGVKERIVNRYLTLSRIVRFSRGGGQNAEPTRRPRVSDIVTK